MAHIVFIPYGKRSEVELLLRDMDAQKHQITLRKGKKTKTHWIQSQVRYLPMGVMEYVCPREDVDIVLTTLDRGDKYQIGEFKLAILRKMAKCKKIKSYDKSRHYLWVTEHVNIIVLGLREDYMDYVDPDGEFKGWKHEAI